jgi:hypothetical protein
MADDLVGRLPAWMKSLYEMKNELRDAARKGSFFATTKPSAYVRTIRPSPSSF